METLSKLFGTELRVKLIRFFLFNSASAFDLDQLEKKMLARQKTLLQEVAFLKKAGLVKEVETHKMVEVRKGKSVVEKKKTFRAFCLSPKFEFSEALAEFFVRIHSLEHKAIVKKIEKTGKVKLVLISGVFTRDAESRLDLFVVGDNIKTSSVDRIVKGIEADIGKDIRYAVLTTPDFSYRMGMNDKLIRDIFEYPHKLLVDKLGVGKA
jgi:hypothetical protein